MASFSDIRQGPASMEKLERELNLKQLQVNRLLNITQAINHNVSASELFQMYRSFLGWEIGVKKMALYVRQEDTWSCTAYIGLDESLLQTDVSQLLPRFKRITNLGSSDHPLLAAFDVVIPVLHKDLPIAYVLIGGFGEEEDMYEKVQFITTITNVIAVAIENKRLFKRQLEQERLRKDIELASEVQRMLIPKSLPSTDDYELASIYKPQQGVGGDYFDFIQFDDGKIVFCVGDISGKGMAAALLMANFQANFHTLIRKRAKLDDFIRDLNHSVNIITGGERFITFFIAEYDIAGRRLNYINAGHNPPVLFHAGELVLLNKGCTILGSFRELPEVEIGSLDLPGEALIFSFTDGLIDLKNQHGEYLNEQLLYDFVCNEHARSACQFNQLLMERIETFRGDQSYPDDFTVLTCKISS